MNLSFKQSLEAVKESVNEAIKETGLKVTNLSLEEYWRANLTITVPDELEQLTAKLATLLRNEGIEMRSLVFSWTLHGGWSKQRNGGQARITISADTGSDAPDIIPSLDRPVH